jgi:hypothetical protein
MITWSLIARPWKRSGGMNRIVFFMYWLISLFALFSPYPWMGVFLVICLGFADMQNKIESIRAKVITNEIEVIRVGKKEGKDE